MWTALGDGAGMTRVAASRSPDAPMYGDLTERPNAVGRSVAIASTLPKVLDCTFKIWSEHNHRRSAVVCALPFKQECKGTRSDLSLRYCTTAHNDTNAV